jgi:hypothetical protein
MFEEAARVASARTLCMLLARGLSCSPAAGLPATFFSEKLAAASSPSPVRPSFGYQASAVCTSNPETSNDSSSLCMSARASSGGVSMNKSS